MTQECIRCRQQDEQFAELMQIISHDLQSPVNKILSFIDLLKKQLGDTFDPKSAEYVERINKNAAVLTVLMKKLRDYANASSVTENTSDVDLNQTIASVQHNLHDNMERSGAKLTVQPLPTVHGRPNQLKMLWNNLISNAIVHRGDRTPTILIRSIERSDEWQFSIQDNGPGISPDDYLKIFKLFPTMSHQPSPSTATGLAVAKKIVEIHGGRIWVESTPEGSTFLFILPRP